MNATRDRILVGLVLALDALSPAAAAEEEFDAETRLRPLSPTVLGLERGTVYPSRSVAPDGSGGHLLPPLEGG